jgi:mutator protein MutT
MPEDAVKIGIAVVEHRGRFLVGTRPAGSELGGYSEFPGGKCRPGESSGVCARRECLEETGLEVHAVELLMRRAFTYAHATVDLNFWLCHPAPRAEVCDDHQGFRWVAARELAALKFPEANQPVIEVLTSRE